MKKKKGVHPGDAHPSAIGGAGREDARSQSRPSGGVVSVYSCFRRGFIGNHPFSTLSRCSKISLMVQNDEKEKTPSSEDSSSWSVRSEPAMPSSPKTRKTHQHRVPQ